jgi:hypothetical protein
MIMAKGVALPTLPMEHAVSDFSNGHLMPKIHHLCKNKQKAMWGMASHLLAFIPLTTEAFNQVCFSQLVVHAPLTTSPT